MREGDVLNGRYRYIRRLGVGGMGEVCLVYDMHTRQNLAMKYCLYEQYADRFEHEVISWLQLGNHPNLVYALYFDHVDGKPALFLEYVDGTTLRTIIAESRQNDYDIPIEDVLDYAIQICRGMGYLHRQSIIHRDLTPSNIIVARGGTIKITDMGLSKLKPDEEEALRQRDLTGIGDMVGTPQYMSPQQFTSSNKVESTTDIYAFGMILYELLTRGRMPFAIDDTSGWMYAHLYTRPKHIKKQLSSRLSFFLQRNRLPFYDLIMQCLAKENENRPCSFAEIEKSLEHLYGEICQKVYRRSKFPTTEVSVDRDLNNKAVSLLDMGGEYSEEGGKLLQRACQEIPECLDARLNLLLWYLKSDKYTLVQFWEKGQQLLIEQEQIAKIVEVLAGGALEKRGYGEQIEQLLNRVENLAAYPELQRIKAKWLYLRGRYSEARELFAGLLEGKWYRMEDSYHWVGANIREGIAKGNADVILLSRNFSLQLSNSLQKTSTDILINAEARFGKNKLLKKSRKLVAGAEMKKKALWHEHGVLYGHKGKGVTAVAITPDGRWGISGGKDKRMRLWDIKAKSEVAWFENYGAVVSAAISLDGIYAATGGNNGEINIWDLANRCLLTTLMDHEGPVHSLMFTTQDHLLLSSGKYSIKLWDISRLHKRSWKQFFRRGYNVVQSQDRLTSMAGSLDGSLIIGGMETGLFTLWVKKGEKYIEAGRFSGHEDAIIQVALSTNGRSAFSISETFPDNIVVWNLKRREKFRFSLRHARCIAVTGNAQQLMAAGKNGAISLADTEEKKLLLSLEGHTAAVNSLAITADATTVLSGSEDGTVRIWKNDFVWPFILEQKYLRF